MLYPLCFKPVFQERIWGGRSLHTLYHKDLPGHAPMGESWEIADRPDAQSEIVNGPLAGKTLHWLMQHHRAALLGGEHAAHGRFPLLVKILDAEDKLSLQVHPPASCAAALGGEPKTEMWYIAHAKPGAELFVGLKKGTTRKEFEARLRDGTVEECFHRVPVQSGDAMFLPSGRVHAIGAGLVIFEIQQNSDTTYRVFDWNRRDTAGNTRQLHVRESLECIDFQDFEPEPIHPEEKGTGTNLHLQTLVEDPLFSVEMVSTTAAGHIEYSAGRPRVIGVVEGSVRIAHPDHPVQLKAGGFCLVPASVSLARIEAEAKAKFLVAAPGTE